MHRSKGFSLIELIIVICLIAMTAAIAGLNLVNYTINKNLRSAARDVASDFAICKQRAISENVTYQIAFDISTPGRYTIQNVVGGVVTNLTTKHPSEDFGTDIRINSAMFGAPAQQTVTFDPRGTVSPLGNPVPNGDGVVLKNSRNSTATVTVSATGRTYVTFNIL